MDAETFSNAGRGIRVASFFSGAGGLDLGFHKTGYNVVFANELIKVFCQTLDANKGNFYSPEMEVCNKDITRITSEELPQNIDLVIGGPPCQTFSASGRRAGGAAGRLDDRGNLFEAYCRIISTIKPKAFLFENVRGILGTNKGQDWKDIVQAFADIGFTVSYRILDACDYGIPQQRERMILVGHARETKFLFPEPLFGPDSSSGRPHITACEALQDVPVEEDLEALVLRGGQYGHLLSEVPPGGNYLFFTEKRGYPKPIFAYRSRFSDFLYKANPHDTIKTLIASPGKYTGPFHWENRSFTIAEYKRLQGFPDDYVFIGKRSDVIKQIGNSVSPKVAEVMALAIAKQIFGRDVEIALMSDDKKLSFDKRKGEKAQKTRSHHAQVNVSNQRATRSLFKFTDYTAQIKPTLVSATESNVFASITNKGISLSVHYDNSQQPFARMKLVLSPEYQHSLFEENARIRPEIEAVVYGAGPEAIQALWNAIDDLIIRSSSFNSLFELYGHFTEPHPIFRIAEFESFSNHPILQFAQHISDFENCSKYFPKSHLTEMFGSVFGTRDFMEIVGILRSYRFDVRSPETNIAITDDVYMVAYPFTLPPRKQMNISLRK